MCQSLMAIADPCSDFFLQLRRLKKKCSYYDKSGHLHVWLNYNGLSSASEPLKTLVHMESNECDVLSECVAQ